MKEGQEAPAQHQSLEGPGVLRRSRVGGASKTAYVVIMGKLRHRKFR